jgi:hypothetical protein
MIVGGPGEPYFSTANPTVCFSNSGEQNLRSYDSSNRQCQCARARVRAYSSPIQALPLVYSAPLRDPPLRTRHYYVESTVVCCTWLRKYRSPPFEFHVRTRDAVHGMPSIGARVRWSYVLTVSAEGASYTPNRIGHRHRVQQADPAIVARIQPSLERRSHLRCPLVYLNSEIKCQ